MRSEMAMPEMQHFMALWKIEDEFGGMTTMSLYRACIFLEEAGVSAPLLTFEPRFGYERQLELLRKNGKITTDVTVLNPYVHYRSAYLSALPEADRFRSATGEHSGQVSEEHDDDGRLFRRTVLHSDGATVAVREYFRGDGTEYLYDETLLNEKGNKAGRILTLVDGSGRVIGRWTTAADFYRYWIKQITGGRPSAIIVDSAFASTFIGPLRAENIIKLVVLHNSHVGSGGDPVRGQIAPGKQPILASVNNWDGIVFLTDEQRQDYVTRFGGTSNLFTISNPKQRARSVPDFRQRSSRRGVLLGRLAPQKNLKHAIRVMAKARESLPDVTLDIYGKGPQEPELRELISELNLSETVYLRGHHPAAADQFDIARFSLLTSRNEGQPLALMESQGRGCPPVAYSIRYGPRDIIEDGISGYLVKAGDIDSAAARIVSLCTDATRAENMSDASWKRAERFSNHSIVARWMEAIEKAWHQREYRTRIRNIKLHVEEIAWSGLATVDFSIRLTWKQDAGPSLEHLLSVGFVVVPREVGPAFDVTTTINRASSGTILATARLEPAAWASEIDTTEDFLDVYCKVFGADVAAMFRVGYPAGRRSLPFVTSKRALSLRSDDRP